MKEQRLRARIIKRFAGIVTVLLMALVCMLSFTACATELTRAAKGLNVYRISAEYNEFEHTLKAEQTLEYVNRAKVPLEEIKFHLYPNAFRKGAAIRPVSDGNIEDAYPDGESWGDIMVNTVKVAGKDTEFSVGGQDRNILTVKLPVALYPNAKYTIDMDYVVRLANAAHRLGYTSKAVNLGNWYPIVCVYGDSGFVTDPYYANGDPFFSEAANYYIDITLNSDFVIAATGRNIMTKLGGKTKTLGFEALAVRDFALALSKEFKTVTRTHGDTTVMYYYSLDPTPDASADIALEAVQVFEDMIGNYPYPVLSVAEVPFLHGGMEYAGLVFISDAVTNAQQYRETIVHEIAHQWWYGVVGNNQVAHAWLDEGLTEYTTTMFYEKMPKYGIAKADRMMQSLQSYQIFVDLYERVKGPLDTSMTRASNEYPTEYEYMYMTYVKGELMFNNIRQLIGEEKFFCSLRQYYKDNKFKVATPAHLFAAFEKAARTDVEPLFNAWLKGAVILGD